MIIYEIKKSITVYIIHIGIAKRVFSIYNKERTRFHYAKKHKKQDYLVPKTVILIQKTLHFVFYQKHAKKIEKPLALI